MKKLVLIGAADSIGVPYTRDNRSHDGFFEMIERELSKDYDLLTLNCFHMSTYNDNRYINRLFSENISLYNVQNSQNLMLKKCKYSGIYPYLELPKSFLKHYETSNNDSQIIIKDCIKNTNTIFIYSAFVNDLLKASNLSLFKLLTPGKIQKELGKVNMKNAFYEVEKNINELQTLNPKIRIFIIGLFVPTKLKYIRENLKEFISEVNSSFVEITNKHSNVFFVDNSNLSTEDFNNIDFHPNKKGHVKIYQNFIEEYKNSII